MQTFVRHLCRVFLIVGIVGLLTLISGVPSLLGYSHTAHAAGDCPPNWSWNDQERECLYHGIPYRDDLCSQYPYETYNTWLSQCLPSPNGQNADPFADQLPAIV